MKIYILFIAITILIFLFTCTENPITDNDSIQPGRRDYVWSLDSIDYGLLPGFIEIKSMWGSSPNDVWGAGFTEDVRNCLWHYDGIKWSRAVEGTPITEFGNGSAIVGGIWGTAKDDVWAFGGRAFSYPESSEPFVMHYDGTQWTEVFGDKNSMPIGFRDIYPLRKDNFWISSVDYVYEYKDGIWKKYLIGEDYVIQSIAGIGSSIYITAYPIGVDSLFIMKYATGGFEIADHTKLFSNGKFGPFGIVFSNLSVFTFFDNGIYKADVDGEKIQTNTWETVFSSGTEGFVNSFKLSNKDIWAIGNYNYPYHYNGSDWQSINIYLGGSQLAENQFYGIWGDGNEIFICDIENSRIHHGK